MSFEDSSKPTKKRNKLSPRVYAMNCLARREMSYYELVQRLIKADYSEQDAYDAVDELQGDNLQNDVRFVEAFVLSKIRRGHGPKKIRFDIQSKKVDASLVEEELARYQSQWLELAEKALAKKYHKDQLSDWSIKQKAVQYLLRKGYDIDIIYALIND